MNQPLYNAIVLRKGFGNYYGTGDLMVLCKKENTISQRLYSGPSPLLWCSSSGSYKLCHLDQMTMSPCLPTETEVGIRGVCIWRDFVWVLIHVKFLNKCSTHPRCSTNGACWRSLILTQTEFPQAPRNCLGPAMANDIPSNKRLCWA